MTRCYVCLEACDTKSPCECQMYYLSVCSSTIRETLAENLTGLDFDLMSRSAKFFGNIVYKWNMCS